jgi:hypothetical protein
MSEVVDNANLLMPSLCHLMEPFRLLDLALTLVVIAAPSADGGTLSEGAVLIIISIFSVFGCTASTGDVQRQYKSHHHQVLFQNSPKDFSAAMSLPNESF